MGSIHVKIKVLARKPGELYHRKPDVFHPFCHCVMSTALKVIQQQCRIVHFV